ncbi:hypothetical protein KC19_3G156700 [Ceratodon purpureus]|uniref:Uncharacterized protein n=1 Tax=Ceratodon purpureus TaxID=3225 RepID=A0A8T0IIS2_CERPU|nr:hypothetical protein KC19_3G156700 [Ceratodon purpureus]
MCKKHLNTTLSTKLQNSNQKQNNFKPPLPRTNTQTHKLRTSPTPNSKPTANNLTSNKQPTSQRIPPTASSQIEPRSSPKLQSLKGKLTPPSLPLTLQQTPTKQNKF